MKLPNYRVAGKTIRAAMDCAAVVALNSQFVNRSLMKSQNCTASGQGTWEWWKSRVCTMRSRWKLEGNLIEGIVVKDLNAAQTIERGPAIVYTVPWDPIFPSKYPIDDFSSECTHMESLAFSNNIDSEHNIRFHVWTLQGAIYCQAIENIKYQTR